MLRLLSIVSLSAGLISCGNTPPEMPIWKTDTRQEIKSLGAYNWIVISEAAFPVHHHASIHTVTTSATLPDALDHVLQSIEEVGHVKPRIYMASEAQSVPEDYAPGLKQHQNLLDKALRGREALSLNQRSISARFNRAAEKYRILVIKTDTSLPYSNIYLELESGYWDQDSETALRHQQTD